jgi:hypothetical protein
MTASAIPLDLALRGSLDVVAARCGLEDRQMLSTFGRSVLTAVVMLSAPVMFAGCGSAHDSQVEQTGALSLRLTTSGGGASYAFPQGAYLFLQSNRFGESVPLDGTETVLTKKLPVGTYTVYLIYPSGPIELEQTIGMTTKRVPANWTNPQPVTVTITEGGSTDLTLSFDVEGFGQIVFARGDLNIHLAVSSSSGASKGLSETGSVNFSDEQYADSSADYASALDIDTGTDYGLSFTGTASGDWYLSSSTIVCRDMQSPVLTTTFADGLAKRLAELEGGAGSICVYDMGASDYVSIIAYRFGAPPADQTSFLTGSQYYFSAYTGFFVGDVFDGTTLNEAALGSETAFSSGSFSNYVYDYSTNSAVLVSSASGTAAGSVVLTP